jgi:hypothetical protein
MELQKIINQSKRFKETIKDEIIRIIVPFVIKYWRNARRSKGKGKPGHGETIILKQRNKRKITLNCYPVIS